jgi:hypothetical protein
MTKDQVMTPLVISTIIKTKAVCALQPLTRGRGVSGVLSVIVRGGTIGRADARSFLPLSKKDLSSILSLVGLDRECSESPPNASPETVSRHNRGHSVRQKIFR